MTAAAPAKRPSAPAPTRFRLLSAERAATRIEGDVIRGCSAIAAGPALGHGMLVDRTTCEQCVAQGNLGPVKVRFTHPSMCADGLGKLVGHASNFRLDDSQPGKEKALCDLTLAESAKITPEGDLHAYVRKLAEESPESFAMSIVFGGTPAWRLDDGSEMPVDDPSLLREGDDDWGAYSYYDRPANATTDEPFARVAHLDASDLVDEPAANPDGLFAKRFAAEAGAQAFADLDALLGRAGVDLERAADFAARYFAARSRGRVRFAVSVRPQPAGTSPAPTPKGNRMKPEELKALKAKHPDHAGLIVDMFADGKSEAEILVAIQTAAGTALQAKVDGLSTQLAAATSAKAAAEAERETAKTALAAAERQISEFKQFGKITDPGGRPGAGGAGATGEAAWRAEFDKSPELKAEFFNSVDAYIAFRKQEG